MSSKAAQITEQQYIEILKSPAAKIASNAELLKAEICDSNAGRMPVKSPNRAQNRQKPASKSTASTPQYGSERTVIDGNSPASEQERTRANREFRLSQARKDYCEEISRVKVTVRIPWTFAMYIENYRKAMRRANRRVSVQSIFEEALCQWYADNRIPGEE